MRADATAPSIRKEAGETDAASAVGVGLRAASRIAEVWGFTGEQMAALLGVSKSTYYRLLKAAATASTASPAGTPRVPGPAVDGAVRERLSLILGIYRGLHLYFSMNEAAADGWVGRPNASPMFGGQSAKDMMLSGNVSDLFRVRQYVDSLLV